MWLVNLNYDETVLPKTGFRCTVDTVYLEAPVVSQPWLCALDLN
jgi:hypothetical protein